jgi:hypothetical protein
MGVLDHTPTIELTKGQAYPDEIREMSYQLWAFKHSRNIAAVCRELKEKAPSLDYDTVHRWAKVDNWPARVKADLVAIAPDIMQSIVTDLIAGAAEGVATVRSVARGDLQVDPTRLQASIALLDRAGFGPRKEQGPLEPPRPTTANQLPPTTDPDELQRRMQVLIERSRQRG